MFNIGVIGTGNISSAHLNGYLAFPEQCRIVALCDIDPDKAERRRVEFGLDEARVYADAAEMLAAEDLDLVSVATPPSTHADLTIAALEAGVNVLVEKPMAPSVEECEAMIAAQRKSGKILSSVAQNRFRDDMVTLKSVLDSGLIGPISHAHVNSAWWRGLSYYDLWWRGTWESEGGGCTLNHAIHHLDLTLWLLGAPQAVMAMMTNAQHENAEVEDLSVALLQYPRSIAEVTNSVVHHGEEQSIVVQGKYARVSQPWSVIADVSQPNGFPIEGGDPDLVARLQALADAHVPLAHDRHAGQIGDVLDAMVTGREPAVTGEDGRRVVELIAAIYAAAIERRAIDVPLADDDAYRRAGTLVERAPRFFAKTASVTDQSGSITV